MGSEPDAQRSPIHQTQGSSDNISANGSPSQGSNELYERHSSRQGTVVIRATVEHIGLAGDTEMTVTVKWPASTFCVRPCDQTSSQHGEEPIHTTAPPNGPAAKNFEPGMLYGEFELNPTPSPGSETSHDAMPNSAEKG